MSLVDLKETIKLEKLTGQIIEAQVFYSTRGGTYSPVSWFFKASKWITAFEIKKHFKPLGFNPLLRWFFKITYGDLAQVIYQTPNPLLDMIPKDNYSLRVPIIIPIKWKA